MISHESHLSTLMHLESSQLISEDTARNRTVFVEVAAVDDLTHPCKIFAVHHKAETRDIEHTDIPSQYLSACPALPLRANVRILVESPSHAGRYIGLVEGVVGSPGEWLYLELHCYVN
jgi:hypothetical protein